jgi:hypothetical protein
VNFWLKLHEKSCKDWVHEMLVAYGLKPMKGEAFEDFFELQY